MVKKRGIIYLLALICLESCAYRTEFYVESLDATFRIKEAGENRYRLYWDKGRKKSNRNYIEYQYDLSDYDPLSLYFPYCKSDTVYVLECDAKVISSESTDSKVFKPTEVLRYDTIPDNHTEYLLIELNNGLLFTDTMKFIVPHVRVDINAYNNGITVYDEKTHEHYRIESRFP